MGARRRVPERTPNLLGALSLFVADKMSDAVTEAAGTSPTAAAALSALYHFLDRPSLEVLRRVLGLTASGTVRLVDQLVEAGYVRRARGDDARSKSVLLTASGRRAAQRIATARSAVLEEALAVLPPDERRAFHDLSSRLLVGLMRGPGAVRWMCRLCDTRTCGHDAGTCPVTKAAFGGPI